MRITVNTNKTTSYQKTPTRGICIDWETSGATWGGDSTKDYQGVSFGAVVFDTATFTPVESLYREIKFKADKYQWSDDAQNIHGLSREYLEENGVTQEDAAVALLELILKHFGPDPLVMMLGHNTEFDRRFTNQLLNSIEFEFSVERLIPEFTQIKMHHVVLDTSSLGFITMGLYKSDLLFKKIGFEDRGIHNAQQDAWQTLMTCKIIKDLVQSALE